MTITISIVNNKGGPGKTTTTKHLARALAMRGKSVAALDLDGQANLTDALLGWRPVTNLGHVLSDGADIVDAIYRVETSDNQLIYCGASDGNLDDTNDDLVVKPLGVMRLRTALGSLPVQTDFVLIDCPPNLGALTYSALIASDYVIIPTKPEVWSINGVHRVAEKIADVRGMLGQGPSVLGTIITMKRETAEHDKGVSALSAPGMPQVLGVTPVRGGLNAESELQEIYNGIAVNMLKALGMA